MMDTKLPVAETFYTLQGEGRSVGVPAVFLRTGGCNLLCGNPSNPDAPQEELEMSDDATWLCDTIDVWSNPNTKTVEEVLDLWAEEGWMEKLEMRGAHLILTGGEPLLQQDNLLDLLEELDDDVTVEVETNGTIVPDEEFDSYIDYYNVSQKLSNSGMPEDRRINPDATHWFNSSEKAKFKYVVSREKDLKEIWEIQGDYGIPNDKVQLMPAGYTREDLSNSYGAVADICKEYGYEFSPRLHVEIWGQATGV